MNLFDLSKNELLMKCEELGITRCKSKNKPLLITLISNKLNSLVQVNPVNDAIPQIQPEHSILTNTLNVIDLFCGCGGMSKGLTDAGLNIIAGIDIWDKAINSYKKNYNHKAICEDLTKLHPEKFNELYNKDKVNIDLIVGGPPCQGFSIAGRRDTKDPRNSLFMEYVKYLNFFKPKAFIMENVMGILSMKTENNEKVIDIIMFQLNENYNCIINKLYASDFEVPQNRRRVIIIGIRKDLNIVPTEPKAVLSVNNRIPVKNILLPKNEVDTTYYLSEKALIGIQNKKIKAQENGQGFGAQYLDMDKPSYTIPARYWKDGYDALVKYSDTEIRRLTITELKRIQSFPDDYILEGTKKDIIMQIGNAVACKFAYHLGKYIIDTLPTNTLPNLNKLNKTESEPLINFYCKSCNITILNRSKKRHMKTKSHLENTNITTIYEDEICQSTSNKEAKKEIKKPDIQVENKYENGVILEDHKKLIIDKFMTSVKGKNFLSQNKVHCGSEGHWLETQMGISHNCKNEPDIFGYEMKKSSKKITFGDFSASKYLFSDKKEIIDGLNNWKTNEYTITRTEFIKYFGTFKEEKNRYSWSGSCVPIYEKWNDCGQKLIFTDELNLQVVYSFEKDKREFKHSYPDFIKKPFLVIAIWEKNKLEQHINEKFNKKGFFICKKVNATYEKICFGKPFDFNHFVENVKNKNIIFDSGMYEGNSRHYSQFRSTENTFWNNLIVEEY